MMAEQRSMLIHDNFRRFSVSRSLLIVAVFRFTHIKLIHRHSCPPVDQTFHRIDGAIETGIQHLDRVSRDRLQHIVRRILTWCRSTDSDLDPHKLGRPDCVNDRLDPIMSPMATGLFDPETTQVKIKIVMDESQVVGGQRKLTHEAFEWRTSDVHPVEGAGEFQESRPKPSRSTMSHAALGETDGPPSRGPLDDPHADIVAGSGIGSAWVAQPNDEAQRYFFFSVSFFSAFGAAAPFFSPPFASAAAAGTTAAAPAFAASPP